MNEATNGFHITGGTFNGPMAAGTSARAVQHIGTFVPEGTDRTTEMLALIRDLVRRHASELGDIQPLLDDTDQIETELQQQLPNHGHLAGSLARLASRVAPIAVIAEAVAALTSLMP